VRPRTIPPVVVPRETCVDYARASRLEWLETNGTGGYAMGTVSGASTRRYHGLLVASLRPPVDRHVTLAKVDERLLAGDEPCDLGANQYPGAVHPRGFERLVDFRLDPFPTWTYEAGGVRVVKRVFLVQGQQTVVVTYEASAPCTLRVDPFLAFRDYHALAHANDALDRRARVEVRPEALVVAVKPYEGLPELALHASGGAFDPSGDWHHRTEYLEELDRGLDFQEDLYRAGSFELPLGPSRPAWLVATFERGARFDDAAVAELERAERARRRPAFEDPLLARLAAAADQFLVRRADGSPTAIAGYPWFTDWGRDTMIALPGLLLARGRLEEARDVIRGFVAHADRGIIPNRFSDHGEPPEYNTVDATLWLFQAVRGYLEAGGDVAFVRDELYPRLREVIAWHLRGTHHGIRVDPEDHLLVAGGEGTQLTWMDARVDGRVMTPRHGKPVEINALWYNALRSMGRWARAFGDLDAAAEYESEAGTVAASFEAKFWNAERGCLHDVLLPEGPDGRVRPNQLFALSLPYPLLPPDKQRKVLRVVERELLTHVGLRTLAPGDPGYVARYRGGPHERDAAYHQGPVWPWLLGPFVRAYLAVNGRTPERIAYCRALFRGVELHLEEACLGTVSEIFDAEAPFAPGGAPAQAWSVAELLWVLAVELEGTADASLEGAA